MLFIYSWPTFFSIADLYPTPPLPQLIPPLFMPTSPLFVFLFWGNCLYFIVCSCLHCQILIEKIWNTWWICMSSFHRGHANLLFHFNFSVCADEVNTDFIFCGFILAMFKNNFFKVLTYKKKKNSTETNNLWFKKIYYFLFHKDLLPV